MITINRYLIHEIPVQVINIPQDAEILTVQAKGGKIYLWSIEDTDRALVPHTIQVLGTTLPIENYHTHRLGNYRGTVQLGTGDWHVFEIGGSPPMDSPELNK